jgi:CubicO group peptidase (beta-lactamase class C family)
VTKRGHVWLTAVVMALGVLFAAGAGLYSFIRTSSKPPLHPNPQAAPSVQHTAPLPKWADAVRQGQQIARAVLAEQNLPGLSVAVGVAGDGPGQEIVWAEGFGWANVEKQVPVAPETRFRIGHASKALTSAAVGLLVEQRRLHLDDEIQTYVPEFPRKQWPVTLRQLMGHVAGVRHYRDTEWGDKPSVHCERASEGLQSFADDALLFEPETQYKYSTFGWVLVSAAVEAAAGQPFFTFMRTQIFDPLGMAETTVDSVSESIPNRTTFYESAWINHRRPASPVDYSCFAGAGAFLSTPSDLVRFGLGINSGKLLKSTTVSMLQTPQQLASGTETEYGLGWMLDTVQLAGEPARLANHASRTLVGGSVSFLTFPDRGLVVVVTTNVSFANTRYVALNIAEVFAEHAKRPAGK